MSDPVSSFLPLLTKALKSAKDFTCNMMHAKIEVDAFLNEMDTFTRHLRSLSRYRDEKRKVLMDTNPCLRLAALELEMQSVSYLRKIEVRLESRLKKSRMDDARLREALLWVLRDHKGEASTHTAQFAKLLAEIEGKVGELQAL